MLLQVLIINCGVRGSSGKGRRVSVQCPHAHCCLSAISSGLQIVSVFRPAGRFLRMTIDPCTVVSVAIRLSLCYALISNMTSRIWQCEGYDKIHIVVNKPKKKSIWKITCSALPHSDMTRSTLPLTKNRNQSIHQLLGLLREVCMVITDYCFADTNRMEKISAEKNSCSHITSCYFWVHQVEHESFYWVFFSLFSFPTFREGKEFLFDVKVTIIHP